MLERGRKVTGLLVVLTTISIIVYFSISATYVVVLNTVALQAKLIPYPGEFVGYIRHRNGKCITVEEGRVSLQHCRRGAHSQIFRYDEVTVTQQSTGLLLVAQRDSRVGVSTVYSDAPSTLVPLTNNKLSYATSCAIPGAGDELPCEGTPLVLSKKCDTQKSDFDLLSASEYDKENWFVQRYAPWGCAEDICSLNYLGAPLHHCSTCAANCKGFSCITAVLQTDDLSAALKTVKSFVENVRGAETLAKILVVYSTSISNTDKARLRLERVSPLIKTYKTLNYIGETGRLNAALHLITTPYLLHLDSSLLFSSSLRIGKMLHVLQNSTSSIVVGNPRPGSPNTQSGVVYVRSLPHGAQLILGAKLYWTAKEDLFENCNRIDFFPPHIFMARVTALRQIGGWNSKLKHYSFLELALKAKTADLNVVQCTDIVVDVVEDKIPDIPMVHQYRMLEALGVDSVVLCKNTRDAAGMFSCRGSWWEVNVCNVDTVFDRVSDRQEQRSKIYKT